MNRFWFALCALIFVVGVVACTSDDGGDERKDNGDNQADQNDDVQVNDDSNDATVIDDGNENVDDGNVDDGNVDDGNVDDGNVDAGGECPMNSGYPCACQTDTCGDGSPCIALEQNATQGFCSNSCNGQTDMTSCATTYGVQAGAQLQGGVCALSEAEGAEPTYCIVVCEMQGMQGACPAGLTCEVQQAEGQQVGICMP